jgi:hypothetical protein
VDIGGVRQALVLSCALSCGGQAEPADVIRWNYVLCRHVMPPACLLTVWSRDPTPTLATDTSLLARFKQYIHLVRAASNVMLCSRKSKAVIVCCGKENQVVSTSHM